MFDILEGLVLRDYADIHKLSLVIYILFSTFVLKLLLGQKQRFIRNDRNILLTYIVFLILFAGTRAKNIGIDTGNYYSYFFIPATQVDGFFAVFVRLKTDVLFELILALTAWLDNYSIVLFSIALILNITLYVFVRKFTNYGKEGSSLILFLTIASSFSFLNLEINIMRNALALGFVLIAIYYALNEKYKKVILFLIIGYLFHRTTIILMVIIVAVIFSKKVPIKYYFVLYIAAIGASVAGFGFHVVPLLAELGSEDLQNLSYTGETNYRIGFRADFVTYNTFFLILFAKFCNQNSIRDMFLLKYYILASVIFFFNFYIPFSDRFGLFSWLIIPLLLYNIVNETFPDKKVFISTVVLILFFVINDVILFP